MLLEMWCPVYVLTLMHDYLLKKFLCWENGVLHPHSENNLDFIENFQVTQKSYYDTKNRSTIWH